MDDPLELLLAERAIARVLHTYSRAADRFDLELMRSCYWPDGTDDHGSYNGGLDGFIEFVGPALERFERTSHFLGNMLIDVDLPQGEARAETYAIAFHRGATPRVAQATVIGSPAWTVPGVTTAA